MNRCRALTLLLCVGLLLAGCGPATPPFECTDDIGCVQIAPGEPVKIGVIQNLSGAGPPGLFMRYCVELALEDRGGQLLGHPVELSGADSRCSGEGGTTAALQVAADPQVIGIIGPSCSGAAATAIKVVSEAGLVMISGSSTAPSLTSAGGEQGPDWQPGFLRTAQNDALAGRVTAIFAFQELGKRRAATIDGGDAYTRGLTGTFREVFVDLGGQVVLNAAVNKGDTDMQPVLNAVAASGAELLYFPLYEPEGNYLVLQAAEMEPFEQITLVTAEGLLLETFIAAVGQAAVGMYGTLPAAPQGSEYETYLAKFKARYQEPPFPMYAATTYDAANLLLDAIEAVVVQDRDGTLHIGHQALRDALYGTAGYHGVTGHLTCDQYGDCGVARFHVTRLDDPAAGLAGLEANVVYTYPPDQ